MSKYFKLETTEDNIGILTFDNPDQKMNILEKSALEELEQHLTDIGTSNSLGGLVIISGKNDIFAAGADINEIASFTDAKQAAEGAAKMQSVFVKLDQLKMTTVCAIHGPCLGGGLELALGCDYRIATQDSKTKLGLPEIQIGLIPGAGGTQRLPRLIGIQAGLDMILTGRKLSGTRALKSGLISACVPKSMLKDEAIKLTAKSAGKGPAKTSTSHLSKDLPKWALESNPLGRRVMLKKARDMVDEKTKGFYPASYKALEAVFDGFDLSLDNGLKLEAKLFGELAMSRESKSLMHLFHATNSIKKNPHKEAVQERFGAFPTQMIGIVGAGFMGAGIATVSADKDIRVRLSDPSTESLGKALKSSRSYFSKKVDRRRLKPFELSTKMGQISPGQEPSGFSTADFAIEAVFEDLDLKQRILKDLETKALDKKNENWFFATNTSALPVARIAEAAQNPDRVIGLHFFSPVEKMPLLEIVKTDKTADWVVGRSIEYGQRLGKQVIVVQDGPGFYTTRALAFFLAEAAAIMIEGTQLQAIDKALCEFGFPVGPITLIDEVGIDVALHVLETMEKAFPERIRTPARMEKMIDSGRLGRKNGRGFYKYTDGKKGDPDITALKTLGVESGSNLASDIIIDRCLLQFVNESARCLEEGVLASPYDGDVGAVFGLGFPPFWGGPFKYVDLVGAKSVVENLHSLSKNYGERFEPAKILQDYANQGKLFFPSEATS